MSTLAFALAFASSLVLTPVLSLATAFTSVLSATLSACIVITPVCGSILTSVTPLGSVQPLASFVALTVTGSVAPSGVYVTSSCLVFASVFDGVTVTEPSSFATTVGAVGLLMFSPATAIVALTVSLEPSL